MDKETVDDKVEEQALEVTIKKEKEVPAPDFDYDDYTPTDIEIQEIEKEIAEKITKRAKNG